MPQAVVYLVNYLAVQGAISVATAVAIGTFAATFGTAVMFLGGLALSAAQKRKATRRARDAFNAAQIDRLVNQVSNVTPRELVLGRVRKGGSVFFKASTGANKTTFVMAIALAGHEIDAVEQIYFNDELVTLDGSGDVTSAPYALSATLSATDIGTGSAQTLAHEPISGTVRAFTGTTYGREGDIAEVSITGGGTTWTTTAGATITYQYTDAGSNANVRAILGTESQAADAQLQALFPSLWTAAHRARAVAYLICEFQYSESSFPTGLPTVTAVIRGAKCYDPRENRLTYSEQFDNAEWTNANTTETANATAAPNGTTTADKIVETAAASTTHWIFQDAAAVGIGEQVTFSCYAKAAERTFLQHRIITTGAFAAQITPLININLSTGVIDGSQGIDSSSIESVGNGWYRVSITATPMSAGTVRCSDFLCITSGNNTYTGDGTSGLYLWGAQLVYGSSVLAYASTTSTIRTPVTEWTQNPALHIRHVYTHPAFGKKASVTAAEDTRIIAAADACDRSTTYTVDGVPQTPVELYRSDLVVEFGTSANNVFDDLSQAMAGSTAFAGGELYLRAGVNSLSVMSLTEADLAVIVRDRGAEEMHPVNISVHRERAQQFNVVDVQIWDADQDYKKVKLTPLKGTALITRDGAELVQPASFEAISYAPQALHAAGVMMRDARDPLTVEIPFKLRAYPLELFDVVDLTLPRYGWTSKLFEVRGRTWTTDAQLKLTLKETTAAIFTMDADFEPQGYAENTGLPSPWYVPPVGALTITSGTAELVKQADGTIVSRMRVTWPAIDDLSITQGGSVEVQYRSAISDGAWASESVDGAQTQIVISNVLDGMIYTVRARARNRVSIGLWGVQVIHKVLGKTEPPPPFDEFLVLVQPDGTRQFNFHYHTGNVPVDWLGAAIRYVPGSDPAPDWDSMEPLQDERTYYTASPVEINAPLSGEYTFACKSLDTSGLYSDYLIQTLTLPDRRLGNVFDEFFEHFEGWLGTLTDCHVQDGYLEADDSTTWATTPATWDLWNRWNMAPASPIYYETPARDLGTVILGQINTTVDADGTVVQELATSADGVTWSAWGTATATFSSRYFKLRLTVTATGPYPIPLVRSFSYQVNATILQEYLNDVDISLLTGSYRIGVGDIRIPIAGSYTVVKRTTVVIQDTTAGTWTATRIDQSLSPSPRWQFRLNGTLTDPQLVDFFIEGY